VSAYREELEREEQTLRRLMKTPPEGSAATINAAAAKLRSTAEQVKPLRAQVFNEEAHRAAARRAGRRELEQKEREKAEERKRREPARKATRRMLQFAHPELRGATLNSTRLSIEEGEELLALVEERLAGSLSAKKEKRYRRLVGVLAGDPDLFERKRTEQEAEERQAAEAKRARLDAMPLRRYEGKGGAYLPAYLHSWLLGRAEGSLSVVDLGLLGTLLLAFEHGVSPFYGSEVLADGAIVLDAGGPFQLVAQANPAGELGAGRVREAADYLARNGWLQLETVESRVRLRPGERARKLLDEATAAVT
jgi:hypothetical protein